MNDREKFVLFLPASFLEGLARLFDLSGLLNQYNYSRTTREADRRAIESDWQFTGDDLQDAIDEYARTHPLGK